MDGLDVCGYNVGYEAFICAFVWVLCLFIAALRWHTRNIKSSFNESREITITLVIVFAVMIFMTVLSFGVAYYPTKVKARILSTALNHFAAAAIWWLPMAAPIYNCLTNRDKYLKTWIFKLRQDGLQCAYHVEAKTASGDVTVPVGNHSYLRSSLHISALNKELGAAAANGELFYAAGNNNCSEIASAQSCAVATESTNLSATNLVQRSQPPPEARWPRRQVI
ncbi:hypothetical protein IWW38_000591 [Coemansia aciculifera]|uniref:Uncharacterized protein n=1 Tax=Coemansia aciculifera TaxID=417176 RepID=A0ACC1MAM0_9FUNG|nr:hypothetical protein IWW38_000591 [Coemansia aciculifera]